MPALDKDGNVLGSVVVNVAKGYGGDISVMTGVDKDGKVTGVNILSHSETAGLGANAVKESFRDQFVGLVKGITVSKDKPGENSIDALTGATVTSRAVTKAVNAAIEKFLSARNSQRALSRRIPFSGSFWAPARPLRYPQA